MQRQWAVGRTTGVVATVTTALVVGAALLAVAPDDSGRAGGVATAAETAPPPSWPGSQSARTVDVRAELGTDVSGLSYRQGRTREADVLWGVDDREGLLHRLVQRGGAWRPDPANGWSRGKRFTFPDGRRPDAEGLVVAQGAAWVSTERDGTGAGRRSILRVPLTGTGTSLGKTREWRLDKEFPQLGANVGLEALDFVPDSFLVAQGFVDAARGKAYDPKRYPRKVTDGVFVTAAEASSLKGQVRAYVLNDDGSVVRVATITNPLGLVMALDFDGHTGTLWLWCDDDCGGRAAAARIRNGRFQVTATHARPTGLGNHNHEGFTTTPGSRCTGGSRPVFWSNDANDGGHALWQGSLPCAPAAARPAQAQVQVVAPAGQAGQRRRVTVTVAATGTVPGGEVTLRVGGRTRTARLTDGSARVWVGRFGRPGPRRVTVSYAGDALTAPGRATARLRTRKAATRLVPVRARVRTTRGTRARVVARLRANGLPARGRVRVTVGGRPVRAQVTRVGHRIVVRPPSLRPGRHRVVVRYGGTRATRPARAIFRVRVR